MRAVQQLTVQLVSVQVLCARVTLSTALVRTFELFIEALSTTPPLPRGAVAVTVTVAVARVAIVLAIASPASVLAAVGRCGGGWLTRSTGGSVHLVSKVRLNLCQILRVRSMHGQDLRRHRRWAVMGQKIVSRLGSDRCACPG